jgi:hypothetical protein
MARSGVEAIDWADLSRDDATALDMHRKAERFGIGRHGLTFPLFASEACKVLFSVNVKCSDAEWASEKTRVTGPVRELGLRFHGRMTFLIEHRRSSPGTR